MKLLYVDTSALFKRYVQEDESEAGLARIEEAPAVGTALITHVEVAAALAQAVRQERMGRREAREAEREFLRDWDDFTRIGVTETLAERAGRFAWQYNLRGYDAVQLAAAVAWQDMTEDTDLHHRRSQRPGWAIAENAAKSEEEYGCTWIGARCRWCWHGW